MFDSHCHLDFPEFDHDRDQILAQCRESGMKGILIPGVAQFNWLRLLQLTDSEPDLYPALGLHPIYIDQHQDAHLLLLAELLEKKRAVAIGEIGLDYFVVELDKERQHRFFVEQLRLAKHFQLPVVLHVRKAHDQVLALLRRFQLRAGIVHAFSGSEQQAYQYIKLGFKLGFGGAMTYDRASKLQHLAKTLPLESIVLETDAPDMAPAMFPHQRNSPLHLIEISQFFADLRGMDTQLLRKITASNSKDILHI